MPRTPLWFGYLRGRDAPLTVTVTLRCQPFSAGHMADRFQDDAQPLVARLKRYREIAAVRAEELDTAAVVVEYACRRR